MTAYQPIQMPTFQGFGIAEAFHQARQEQRQNEAQAWDQMMAQGRDQRANNEMEMQRSAQAFNQQQATERKAREEQDRNAKIQEHVTELHNKGLGKEAAQFAAAYGITGAPQSPGQAPTAPQEPQEPQAPEFVGPIDSPEHASSLARQEFASQASPQDGSVVEGMQQAGQDAAGQVQQQQSERDQFAQLQAAYPQQQAQFQQQQQQFDQRVANPVVNYQGPNGVSFQVDPMEREAAARAMNSRRADQFRSAFQASPEMQQYAQEFGARAELGEDPRAIFTDLSGRQKADAAAHAKEAHDQTYSPTVKMQDKWHTEAAAAARANANARTNQGDDTASARAQATLERAINDADRMVDWKGLVSVDNTMRGLMANLGNEANPLQHKDAMIQLARYFRQAQPTEGEMHLLYQKLGGTADKWSQFVSSLESGDISPKQLAYVRESAQAAHHEYEQRKARTFGALAKKFGPGSGLEMLAPRINAELKARGELVGVDVPDLYEVTPDQQSGAMLLGSKAKKRGVPKAAMAPEDKAAIDWANAHPQDPRAAKILKLHGGQ